MTRLCVLAGCLLLIATLGCGDNVTFPATGTIYGELYFEDGSPALGVKVLVEGTGLSTVTRCEGQFVINGVVAVDESGIGKYYVVRGAGYKEGVPVGFLVDDLMVDDKASYSVGRVTVPPTGKIFGYVRLSGTGDHSGIRLTLDGTSMEAVSRADGSFTLDRVPAHEGYRVICHREGYEERVIDTMPGEVGPVPLAVTPGQTTTLDLLILERLP